MNPWQRLLRAVNVVAAVTVALCLFGSQTPLAQPAAPDPSFGTANGRVTLPPFDEEYSSCAHSLALLPDGRMVIGGNCSQPYSAMCFIRFFRRARPILRPATTGA
jgi:hypothetical protein